jgi:hypothetical protein
MKGCLQDEVLQAWLDGELSPREAAAVRSHLTDCPICEALARAAQRALSLAGNAWQRELEIPVPTARLRDRIEGALASPPAIDRRPWPHIVFAQWRIGVAFVALAVMMAALATAFQSITPAPVAKVARLAAPDTISRNLRSVRPRATVLESETNKHFGQAQLLLRSIRNAEAGTVSDLAYERDLSRELLSRNRLLRRRAEQKDLTRAEKLLNDVEPLLLDIANLPDRPEPDDMRSLKDMISSQQIIAELQLYTGKNLF